MSEKMFVPVTCVSGKGFDVAQLKMGDINELVAGLIGSEVRLVFGIPTSFILAAVKDCPDLGEEADFEIVSDAVEAFEIVNPSVEPRLNRMISLK